MTPLEPIPAKGGSTSKQREAALQQVGLWLVARECLKQESLRENGQKLAERALESSRRLPDTGYTLAILREMGQIALQAGDNEAAKKRWSEMLEIAFPAQGDKAKRRAVDEDKQPAVAAAGSDASAKPATPAPSRGAVVTLSQFEQLTQIAKLAAENGIDDLSIEAMSRALQSGPPIQAMLAIDINQNTSLRNVQENEPSPVAMKVQQQLTKIENLWRQKGLSEESIYNMLEQAVAPAARPLEVFLHPQSLVDQTGNGQPHATLETPTSVGVLLAASAVKANKVEKLKQLLEPRVKQPLGEVSGRVLLTQLALAADDLPEARQQLELLSNRLKQDSSMTSNELAGHAAIPALAKSEIRAVAAKLLEQAIDHLAQSSNPGRSNNVNAEPLRTFRLMLARSYFKDKNGAAGRHQLEEYISSLAKRFQNYGGRLWPLSKADRVFTRRRRICESRAADGSARLPGSLRRFARNPELWSNGDL